MGEENKEIVAEAKAEVEKEAREKKRELIESALSVIARKKEQVSVIQKDITENESLLEKFSNNEITFAELKDKAKTY